MGYSIFNMIAGGLVNILWIIFASSIVKNSKNGWYVVIIILLLSMIYPFYRSILLNIPITSAGYFYVIGTIFNNIPKLLIAFYGVRILNKKIELAPINKAKLGANVLLIILFYIINQYTVDLISMTINQPLEFSIESLILDSLFYIGLLVFINYKKQGSLILTIYFIIELYIGMSFVLIYNPHYFIVSLPYFLSNIFCSAIFIVGYFNARNND